MRFRKVADGLRLARNVWAPMRDGARLSVNVFRPEHDDPLPVIMSVTPYDKNALPDRLLLMLMRLAGVRFGKLACSRWAGFESPDPVYWTQAGYAVVQADARGMHRSEGQAGVLTDTDAEDYAELIAWAAAQPWSTGVVGLLGVSYLAMSQWRVAALRPPALKAIAPWEGVTDLLREFGYQDGVPETGFIGIWWNNRIKRGRNRRFPIAEDFPADRDNHPLDGPYWAAKRPALEEIDVPALVCASWSDQGLHTRGSLVGFEKLGSCSKWLFTHGRRKWETFYSPEARAWQRRFLDRYVKGEQNGWEATPRVRLETRRSRDVFDVRPEDEWPPSGISLAPLFLDAAEGRLTADPPAQTAASTYQPADPASRARFSYAFSEETELTGSMALKLWVSVSEGDDADIFVVLRKFDARGHEVCFYGYNGFAQDAVAKGWLRASHRELDPASSRPGRPWHAHRRRQPIGAGEIVAVEIEILASSTVFEAGSSLRVEVLGCDGAHYPAFKHGAGVNRGRHSVHTGGRFDSRLLVPFRRAERWAPI